MNVYTTFRDKLVFGVLLGMATAPRTPDRSRLGTAPGTPDRYSLNRDITGKGKAVVDTSTDAVTTEMKDVIVGSFKKRCQ